MANKSLYNAIVTKNILKLRHLILNGADVNTRDFDYKTPLHIAIRERCDPEVIQLLLDHGADLHAKEHTGLTPLHFATKCRVNNKMVKFLLSRGADPDIQDYDGKVPLWYAVRDFNIECMRLLLNFGANPNAKDMLGRSLFHCVLEKKRPYQFWYLKKTAGPDHDTIKTLIENGADPNLQYESGLTAFFEIAFSGQVDYVKIILNYCFNVFYTKGLVCKMVEIIEDYQRIYKSSWKNIQFGDKFSIEECMRMYLRMCVRLNVLGLVEDSKMFSVFSKVKSITNYVEWKQMESICIREGALLRSEIICENRSINYADILTRPLRKVAVLVSVEDIQEELDKVDLHKKFPIYAELLHARISWAKNVKKTLDSGYQSLNMILGEDKIPHASLLNIVDFLSIRDIKTLNNACFRVIEDN